MVRGHRSDNSEHALRVACAAAIVRLHNATQAGPAIEDTAVGEESIASGPGK